MGLPTLRGTPPLTTIDLSVPLVIVQAKVELDGIANAVEDRMVLTESATRVMLSQRGKMMAKVEADYSVRCDLGVCRTNGGQRLPSKALCGTHYLGR